MPAGHRIPRELPGFEVPAAALVDQLVPEYPGRPQRGVAVHGGVQHGDTALCGVDAVDVDLVIDSHQALAVAAVEGPAQIAEHLAIAGVAGIGMTERRDPALTVTVGVGPVVPGAQVEDGGPSHRGVEELFLLIGQGHLGSPASLRNHGEIASCNTNLTPNAHSATNDVAVFFAIPGARI